MISSVLFWMMDNILLHLSEVVKADNDLISYFTDKLDCSWNVSGCPTNWIIYHTLHH